MKNIVNKEAYEKLVDEELKASDLNGKAGISAQALPFYAGNKFYLIYLKTYSDVRMVAAPPSSIGKFGGETDNWMCPRHLYHCTKFFRIFQHRAWTKHIVIKRLIVMISHHHR